MTTHTLLIRLAILSCLVGFALPAVAQHCGGPCLVPRGADPISANPRFTLVPGKEKDNWRYLFNWIWTEDGKPKHRLENVLNKAPLSGFGSRRMFISPDGNGFLVTGNAYAKPRYQRRYDDESYQPMLFVFCDPTGKRLVELPLAQMLTKKEQQIGSCLNCKCCKDVLHVFAMDPALSKNGCFVDLQAYGTKRPISFFLPLGLPILDKGKFENYLAAAQWERVLKSQRKSEREAIASSIGELESEDSASRSRARKAIAAKGFLALSALQRAHPTAAVDASMQIDVLLEELSPYPTAGWQALTTDLGLLSSLMTYPDNDVVRIVHQRLGRIVPDVRELGVPATITWLAENRSRLKWNSDQSRYEL